MAQIHGPNDTSYERCVHRVEVRIARSIRHGQVNEGEIFTRESLLQRGFIEPDDAKHADATPDNLTARDMLDHIFAYSHMVKRSR